MNGLLCIILDVLNVRKKEQWYLVLLPGGEKREMPEKELEAFNERDEHDRKAYVV